MESITLKYSEYVIENCEDAWDESVVSGVTPSADASVYYTGAASAKFVVSSTPGSNALLASEVIQPSLDISDCTSIKVRMRCSIALTAGQLKLLLDDTAACASPLEAIDIPAMGTPDTWVEHTLTPATPSALTAIISIGLKQVADVGACSIWIDDVRAILPSQSFSVLSVKGMDDPEHFVKWPGISDTLLDGSAKTHISSFYRIITIDFGVVQTKAYRVFLFRWVTQRPDNQQITFGSETLDVVEQNPQETVAEWKDGIDFSQAYVLVLREKSARRSVPSSWLS